MFERILTFDPAIQHDLTAFIRQWFAPEDDVLSAVRQNTRGKGLPEIQIRPEEGQILGFLAQMLGARRILEIGTLAGYSGIWLARALPPDGKLITLEREKRHAALAREHFNMAGVSDRVEIREGDAMETLDALDDETFDMVFIDAEKSEYPTFLTWAVDHVRSGGLITAHNAFREGQLVAPNPEEGTARLREFLQSLASDARLTSTIIPVGDGIAAAIVK
ncbi:O-methyltransferase [Aggregatilinea lenta]|uniref:O-methyltransferase n=1 Tax=Aggregatilinea lenta TaxID=913108 RepID=UPI000E5AAE46|nr:O-methyltransferase [Aggregatilinea lenta]